MWKNDTSATNGGLLSVCLLKSLAVGAVMALPGLGAAHPFYLGDFQSTYPDYVAPTEGNCQICHISGGGGGARNAYGLDVAANVISSFPPDWASIEQLDSDGDGTSNIDEINANRLPGRPPTRQVLNALLGMEPQSTNSLANDVNGDGRSADSLDAIVDIADFIEARKRDEVGTGKAAFARWASRL